MGDFISKLFKSIGVLSDLKSKILMLGLDGAGKTTILYQMKLNQTSSSVPTVGFNVQEIKYKGLTMTTWDIGGQSRLRQLWHHYYEGSDAVIYVLDSSDADRIELAKQTLEGVINHCELSNVPVLIFANKMDMSSIRPDQIVEQLGLHRSKRTWHLQPCCALNGEGIIDGFQWLSKAVKSNRK